MAFPKEQPKIPVDVDRMTVSFTTFKGSTEVVRGSVDFDVVDAAGAVVGTVAHNALTHMTAAQKTALFNFMAAFRTKAKAEAV